MAGSIEVPLSSNFVNIMNFVLFDIVLISAVYHLTADLAGRLNFFALSAGDPKRLTVLCPPLLGGGVCSTSWRWTFTFLLIRFAALSLIFGANLTIEGRTVPKTVFKEERIRVPGPIAHLSAVEYKRMVSKRMSCQVTQGNFIFFGEFRENDTCVFDLRRLTNPVSLSITVEVANLDIGECSNETRPHSNKNFGASVILLRCTKAQIHCVGTNVPRGCKGFIQKGKTAYLCDEFWSRKNSVWTGVCREVRNLDIFKNEFWFDAKEIKGDGLYSNYGATSIMQTDTRTVKDFEGQQNITQILKAWFFLCAAKVVMVIALACAVMYSIFQNASCLLNDERSLVRLLETSVPRFSPNGSENSDLYLHVGKVDSKTVFWASGHQERRTYNQEINAAERAAT